MSEPYGPVRRTTISIAASRYAAPHSAALKRPTPDNSLSRGTDKTPQSTSLVSSAHAAGSRHAFRMARKCEGGYACSRESRNTSVEGYEFHGTRALDQPDAERDAEERDQVRTWQRARLENQPSEQADGDRRRRRSPHAARRRHRAERGGEQESLERLHPGGARPCPECVGAQIEQPRRVILRVIAIGETEKIRADEMSRGCLAALREMPPEIRLVCAAETDQPRCRKQDEGPEDVQLPAHSEVVSRS